MNRTDIIQKIVERKRAQTYLEIGVHNGSNFFRIKARQKVGVDVHFTFSARQRIKWAFKNFSNFAAEYHQSTSDHYFERKNPTDFFDVVFIDGLHTYEQSLKDVNNSLRNLNETGVIVMHDCNPPNQAAAYPTKDMEELRELNLPGWTGEWCGDVWKTICNLRSNRKDLKVFVLDCDYGVGIVTKGQPESWLDFEDGAVDEMTYEDLARNRRNLLNLRDERYLFEFLGNM